MHLLAVASLKNRALIALITIAVAIFGTLALTSLKQELTPPVEFPTVIVSTTYPGASPEVVNQDISTPIETAIQGVPGLEATTATSSTNSSIIQASFTYGTDLLFTEQKIQQAINRIKNTLPEGVEPLILSGGISDFPVLQIAVTGGPDANPEELAAQVEASALADFADIDGVREARLNGAVGTRVVIIPDDAKMTDAGVTNRQIEEALAQNGLLIPAGEITEDGQTLAVQTGGKVTSVEEIASLPIPVTPVAPSAANAAIPGSAAALAAAQAADPKTAVTIGEIASVQLVENPVTTISRVNGEPALTIAITKLVSANTVEVSNAVKDAIPQIESTLDGVTFVVVFDQAPFIEKSIETLAVEGLLGLVFAVLVILVFLLSVSATLVTAISIPTSVLITFIGLQAAEYSLNILTLGALTIAIGRVVDDSIVVIENIKRFLAAGQDKMSQIVTAVREVAGAITASTITSVAVFLPLAFVGDVTGELFRPFALTVTIALLASLLVSLTIVPVLAYWFLRPDAEKRVSKRRARKAAAAAAQETANTADGVAAVTPAPAMASTTSSGQVRIEAAAAAENRVTRLQRGYHPIINFTLKRPVVTLLGSLLILVLTFGAAPLLKTNFLGADGQNSINMTQALGPGTSLEAQLDAAIEVEETLAEIPDVEIVQVTLGAGTTFQAFFGGAQDGSISYALTTNPDADQVALQDEIRATVAEIPDAGEFAISAGGGGFGGSSEIEIEVTSPSQDSLREATDELVNELKAQESLTQVESNLGTSRPFVEVAINRQAAANEGYSEVALASLISQKLQPDQIGQVVLDATRVSVYIEAASYPQTLAEIEAVEIPTPSGDVALSSLATVSVVDGPVSITTVRGNRSATITATPVGDNLAVANAAVATVLEETDLPAGVSANIGGVTADQGSAFGSLGLALLAAILIVYIVMVATFKSLLQPLLLLVSVPFAATGAIALQLITGIPLGVASLIGLLMLIGIVVTNAIVLVDLINQFRAKGKPLRDAVFEGSSRRLRPILMTALATIFALLPMGFGLTGEGGFISQPLALVVIGGLLSSTILTLIVLPALYFVVERARERSKDKRASRKLARQLVSSQQ
jgi:HAE1 family hydrophobic/amphiphilic exporter-1